jgi:hypothetical protein
LPALQRGNLTPRNAERHYGAPLRFTISAATSPTGASQIPLDGSFA